MTANVLTTKWYVFARGLVDGTETGYGYVEVPVWSPEEAMRRAQQQPWPEGTELGVSSELNVAAVDAWVPAHYQVGGCDG